MNGSPDSVEGEWTFVCGYVTDKIDKHNISKGSFLCQMCLIFNPLTFPLTLLFLTLFFIGANVFSFFEDCFMRHKTFNTCKKPALIPIYVLVVIPLTIPVAILLSALMYALIIIPCYILNLFFFSKLMYRYFIRSKSVNLTKV